MRPGVPEQMAADTPPADAPAADTADTADSRVAPAVASAVAAATADRFSRQAVCWRADADGGLRVAPRADTLAGPGAALDPQALFEYLYFHVIPAPRTVFKGVQRLRAGHDVRWDGQQAHVSAWWRPSFDPNAHGGDFAQLRERFLGLLKDSVQRALGPGAPACFLSGGTDSSTVAGLLRDVTGQAPQAFSIGFDAAGYDEMDYARLAARHFGARHHEYYITPDDLVRSIPVMAAAFDQPFGNSSVLPTYYCALQARQAGVQHLLAGDGGDELFGGNVRYAKQRVFDHYDRVPALLRRGLLEPLFGLPVMSRLPLLKKGASYIEQARTPMPDRLAMHNLLHRLGPQELLMPGFMAQVDLQGPAVHQRQTWAWAEGASDLNRMLAYDWQYTLADSDLPKVRSATALAGVGVSFPLLDDALLAFSMTLPDDYKLKGQKLRWFFKEALRGYLPDEIIDKPKHGFGLPFGPWALKHAPLMRLAADSLHSLAGRGMVQPGFIRRLVDDHMPAHPGYYGEMVWVLMMLEQWLQAHAPKADFRG